MAGRNSGCSGNVTGMANPSCSMRDPDEIHSENLEMTDIPKIVSKHKKDVGAAVCVRNGNKAYTAGKPVLSTLNMTVPCGSIYGLLGSSGCGKTTLLSCIVGVRKLNSGNILVFGARPGSPGIGIPGKNIGYMPQDIALHDEFSISETLFYFGVLCGMTWERIATAKDFFMKLLDLPENSNQVRQLSGGQKRRLSFATALMHSPELLILDEPTVGVDPILRQKIWEYLIDVVARRRTTVILTTHYIEEAKQANFVGLMRNGKLLAESPTQQLMASHGTSSLEEIVLKLCRGDMEEDVGLNTAADAEAGTSASASRANHTLGGKNTKMARVLRRADSSAKDSVTRITALAIKNFTIHLRNLFSLFIVVGMSAVSVCNICYGLGGDPCHINFGIVNLETNVLCRNVSMDEGSLCISDTLSCHFLHSLEGRNVTDLKYYANESEALDAVHLGNLWGYLIFPPDFSTSLFIRFAAGRDVDDLTLNMSTISVRLDLTNKPVTFPLKKALYDAYKDFISGLLGRCGSDPRKGLSSLNYKKAVYGSDGTSLQEYIGSGAMLVFILFFEILASSVRFIKDNKSGVLQRSLVLGVNTWELIVAYSISEFLVLLVESLLNVGVLTLVFGIEVQGSTILVLVMLLLVGYVGVSMGFMLGLALTDELQAALLAMASIFPTFFLCGVLWPLLSLPEVGQAVAPFLPCTYPTEALRSIISRGWGIDHPNVWSGAVVLLAYTFVFCILTVIFHKVKQ